MGDAMNKQHQALRDVFAEVMEGLRAMKEHREGKLTLPTHKVAVAGNNVASPLQVTNQGTSD